MAKNKDKIKEVVEDEGLKEEKGSEKTETNIEKKVEQHKEEQHEKKQENPQHEKHLEKEEQQPNKEQEYLQMAQKIQAEFENYKKRTIKAEKDAKINGIIETVTKFLPVIDSFNIAQKQEQNQEYLKANAIIINQLNKALSDLGVEKIEALGKQFDYNLHNAIMIENNENYENNEIIEVFQEGYRLKDKIIRHSIVKVNQK